MKMLLVGKKRSTLSTRDAENHVQVGGACDASSNRTLYVQYNYFVGWWMWMRKKKKRKEKK